MTLRRFHLLALVAVAAAALLAAGCGSSNSASTSTQSSAEQWVDGLCNAVSTYKTAVVAAGSTAATLPLSADNVNKAVTDAKAATNTFVDTIKGLGKPDTSSGQQAQKLLSTLSTELQADLDKIQTAVNGVSGTNGLLTAVTVGSSTLVTAENQIKSTYNQIKALPGGELTTAFKNNSTCQALTKS